MHIRSKGIEMQFKTAYNPRAASRQMEYTLLPYIFGSIQTGWRERGDELIKTRVVHLVIAKIEIFNVLHTLQYSLPWHG